MSYSYCSTDENNDLGSPISFSPELYLSHPPYRRASMTGGDLNRDALNLHCDGGVRLRVPANDPHSNHDRDSPWCSCISPYPWRFRVSSSHPF
ncbi:hypothetical protein BRARA_I02976 [Brassica rapa]|uniref:Uncharacterized protein n=1 Tax=Brassica campestris TaxID=3711 RepID=A0A397Y3P7_BRACM|nr:hypothetical protein BRARA_I02976 [Brassica rapa]